MVSGVPFVAQPSRTACGEAALSMLLAYWKRPAPLANLAAECRLTPGSERVTAGTLRDVARAHGLQAFLVAGQPEDLARQLREGHPLLVGVVKRVGLKKGLSHYELVAGLNPRMGQVLLADPDRGWREEPLPRFLEEWSRAENLAIVALGPAPPAGI